MAARGIAGVYLRRYGRLTHYGELNTMGQFWRAVKFTNADSAVAFERYLKTGSGRAFAKRHFV